MGAFVNGKFKETYKEYKKNGAYLGGLYVKKGHEREAYKKIVDHAVKKGKKVYIDDIYENNSDFTKLWDVITHYNFSLPNVTFADFNENVVSQYDFIITNDLSKYVDNHHDRKPFVLVFPKEDE